MRLGLLLNFCCDFYGCTLWDLPHSSTGDLYISRVNDREGYGSSVPGTQSFVGTFV